MVDQGVHEQQRSAQLPARIRPLHIVYERGMSDLEKRAIQDGISEVLQIAKVTGIELKFSEGYKKKTYLDEKTVIDFCRGLNLDDDIINGEYLGEFLNVDVTGPEGDQQPDHYVLWMLTSPVYGLIGRDDQKKFDQINGKGLEGIGAFVSTNRFSNATEYSSEEQYGLIKSYVMHELLHIFGLVPEERATENRHCKNECIMQPRENLFEQLTTKTLDYGRICEPCQQDLVGYFQQ